MAIKSLEFVSLNHIQLLYMKTIVPLSQHSLCPMWADDVSEVHVSLFLLQGLYGNPDTFK